MPAPPGGRSGSDWEIEAVAGTYDFAAAFPSGERGEARNMTVRPPYKSVAMRRTP
jgi:hypothetical protein